MFLNSWKYSITCWFFWVHVHYHFFIRRDVNINAVTNDGHAKYFHDSLSQHACSNTITLPTTITLATSVDIYISNPTTNKSISSAFAGDIDDHFPIFCLCPILLKKNTNKPMHSCLEL